LNIAGFLTAGKSLPTSSIFPCKCDDNGTTRDLRS